MAASEKKLERKKYQNQKDVQTNSKQQKGLSRSRDSMGKPDQEKVASSEKDVARDREREVNDKEPQRSCSQRP